MSDFHQKPPHIYINEQDTDGPDLDRIDNKTFYTHYNERYYLHYI